MRHFHYLAEVEIESYGHNLLQVNDEYAGKLATTNERRVEPI